MGRRTVFTTITPLPASVPRQLALDMLHSHAEVIELNPLVTGVRSIEAPRDSSSDEYFSNWYEITEIITWGLGFKKKISFNGVFHDQPWGLQSHVYAPFGVDLRNKYRVGGNQPGEPREARELGLDTPLDGLYLRNDAEIVANMALTSFVKKEMKQASAIMIERLTRKAELLDEGKLHAMFENGKLKTAKPGGLDDSATLSMSSPPASPAPFRTSPSMQSPGGASMAGSDPRSYGNYYEVSRRTSQHLPNQYTPNAFHPQPDYQHGQPPPPPPKPYNSSATTELPGAPEVSELPAPIDRPGSQSFRSELPGDSTFIAAQPPANTSPQPPQYNPQHYPPQFSREYKPVSPYDHPQQQPPQPPPPPPQQYQTQQQQRQYQQQYAQQQQQYTPPTPPRPLNLAPSDSQSSLTQDSNSSRPSLGRHSTNNSSIAEPDHQRFASLSVGSGSATGGSKCPTCGIIEVDDVSLSRHLRKAHYT